MLGKVIVFHFKLCIFLAVARWLLFIEINEFLCFSSQRRIKTIRHVRGRSGRRSSGSWDPEESLCHGPPKFWRKFDKKLIIGGNEGDCCPIGSGLLRNVKNLSCTLLSLLLSIRSDRFVDPWEVW